MIFKFTLLLIISFSSAVIATGFTSIYVGQQHRQIKSLSSDDIRELREGGGWGLAKAAELNGLPGPVHVLEMKEAIHLSDEQGVKILAIYNDMKKNAIDLGKTLIELETELDRQFADRTITRSSLEQMIGHIEKVKAELRYVHLSAHLVTPEVLTAEQIALYNQLRGYSKNPCENIPQDHSKEMWKRHNGCI